MIVNRKGEDMKFVIQRVNEASVAIEENVVGKINKGFLVFIGVSNADTKETADKMIKKLIGMRIFDDENGIMNKSILDVGGEILSISQFTLYGDASKGNRPSYIKALNGEQAIKLYELFNHTLKEKIHVETGKFGAEMEIKLINDGPITILLER